MKNSNYENSSIDIKDKIVSEQSHSTNDVTCGGSLENPTHKLSKKIEKSIFPGLSLSNPTEEDRNFIFRDENDNVMVVDKTSSESITLWKKIETISDFEDGLEYLLVYEPNSVIFDSSLENLDSTPNTYSVEIVGNEIENTPEIENKSFTISNIEANKISILAKNGKYIGRDTNSNGIQVSDTPLENTLSDNLIINGKGGRKLCFNASSAQLKFRYLAASTTTDICLYKKVEKSGEDIYTWKTLVSNDDIDVITEEELDEILVPQCIEGNKMDC